MSLYCYLVGAHHPVPPTPYPDDAFVLESGGLVPFLWLALFRVRDVQRRGEGKPFLSAPREDCVATFSARRLRLIGAIPKASRAVLEEFEQIVAAQDSEHMYLEIDEFLEGTAKESEAKLKRLVSAFEAPNAATAGHPDNKDWKDLLGASALKPESLISDIEAWRLAGASNDEIFSWESSAPKIAATGDMQGMDERKELTEELRAERVAFIASEAKNRSARSLMVGIILFVLLGGLLLLIKWKVIDHDVDPRVKAAQEELRSVGDRFGKDRR